MKLAHSLSLALAISTVSAPGWAADAGEHQAHHPVGAASASSTKAMPGTARPETARMDSQMQATMQMMMDRLPAAPTK